MSDNKALVTITIIVVLVTTIFFVTMMALPRLTKTAVKQPNQTYALSKPKNTGLPLMRAVLGASTLHINSGLEVSGTTQLDGDVFLGKNANLHIDGIELTKLLANLKKETPVQNNLVGVTSLQKQIGNLALSEGNGIAITGLHIANNDTGSAQSIFKTISAGTTNFSAQTNNDTLTFAGSNGITVTAQQGIVSIADTNVANLSPYGIAYANANASLTTLQPATAGYILQSNGTGYPPSWTTNSASNPAFATITSGINTLAAMIVGPGASLTYTGGTATSGGINANRLLDGTWVIPGTIGSTTPNTGAFTTITANTINGLTIPNNGNNSLNVATGKSLLINNSLTFTGTDNTNFTFPTMSDTLLGRNSTDTLTNKTLLAPILSGITTFANLGTGIAHINGSGVLSSSAVNLASADVTGTLPVANGGTDIASYSTGDMLYASATTTLAKLPIGQAGQLLTVSGGVPTWTSNPAPPSSGGFGFWQLNNGALSPTNSTNDLLLGGISTSSATFGFLNIAGGTPTATIAGNFSLEVPRGVNAGATLALLNGGSLDIKSSTGGNLGLISRVSILNNGNLGIGSTSATKKLDVAGDIQLSGNLYLNGNSIIPGNANLSIKPFNAIYTSNIDMGGHTLWNAVLATSLNANTNSITNVLNLGIGSSTPLANSGIDIEKNALGNAALVVNQQGLGDIITASKSGATVFKIDTNGNARIGASLCVKANLGTNCSGSSAGTIYATNTTVTAADLAENYISSQLLVPGDIVMPAQDGNNQAVRKTTETYQPQSIGIVSTNPGVTLNSDAQTDAHHPHTYPIALSGRVPVRVSSSNGFIQAGDPLTTSAIAGVAMKATKAGVIIGKALEDYTAPNPKKIGSIMIFAHISWTDPQVQITDAGDIIKKDAPLTSSPPDAPIANQITALSQQMTTIQTQLASSTAQRETLHNSELLNQRLQSLEQRIALLDTASLSGSLLAEPNETFFATLSSSGKAFLHDVGITGNLTDGLLTINGMDTTNGTATATINTLAQPLKIQSLALNGVDFLNGKILIDTAGNLVVHGDITAKKINIENIELTTASLGESVLPTNQKTITVKTHAVSKDSQIFVTAKTPIETPLFVANKQADDSFTIAMTKPAPEDIHFSWWIVN